MSAESEDIHAQKSVCGDLACRCTVMKALFTFFGTKRFTGDFKKFQKNFEKFFPHVGTVEENT